MQTNSDFIRWDSVCLNTRTHTNDGHTLIFTGVLSTDCECVCVCIGGERLRKHIDMNIHNKCIYINIIYCFIQKRKRMLLFVCLFVVKYSFWCCVYFILSLFSILLSVCIQRFPCFVIVLPFFCVINLKEKKKANEKTRCYVCTSVLIGLYSENKMTEFKINWKIEMNNAIIISLAAIKCHKFNYYQTVNCLKFV